MKRLPFFLFVISFVGLMTFLSCAPSGKDKKTNRQSSPKTSKTSFVRPKPVPQGYVGSEACRECHQEIMKEYESHPMSRSMAVTASSPIANYSSDTQFSAMKGLHYAVKKSDDKVIHREIVSDKDGNEVVHHDEEIDFTCGSGTRGCSYFLYKDGKLFQSPVTWYGKKEKWDLSPGYNPPGHPRFERMASDGCLACHAGRMNPIEKQRSTFNESKPFLELAIGCERCHGPGQKHIDFHNSSGGASTTVDPIVNPEKLSPEKRDAVCYQCHLQGENRVTRYGRSEYDFRPGMLISDIWVPFLKSGQATDGKTEAVSQVEQMQQSKCYTQSNGQFGCVSCHDPHKSPSEENKIDFYREQCIECHQTTDQTDCGLEKANRIKTSPKDSCIQCHMPRLNAGDVPHTPQTDHRVHIPNDEFDFSTETDNGFRTWTDGHIPSYELARAKTIALAEQVYFSKSPKLIEKAMSGLRIFHPAADDDLELNEALAQIYWAQGDHEAALVLWKKVLKLNPDDEFLLTGIVFSLQEANRSADAFEFYERLIAINDSRPETLRGFVDVCTSLNKIDRGIAISKRILELDPGSQITHAWLARAYATSGDEEKAKYHDKMAKKLAAASAK